MTQAEPRVAVVGGGLAGLTAALELLERGIAVTVLERAKRPGGRARSVVRDGLPLEILSPVVSSADTALLALVTQSGAGDVFLPLRPVIAGQFRGGRISEVDPRGLRDFARIPGLRRREALRLVRLPRLLRRYAKHLPAGEPEAGAPLDDRSVADFGRLYFGPSAVEHWLGPFASGTSLGDPDEISRVHLLRRQRFHFGAPRGLPRVRLDDLVEAAAGRAAVLTDADVRLVRPLPGGGLVVDYAREGRERGVEVDGVVVTVPAPDAAMLGAAILTTGERDVLCGVRSHAAVTLCARSCRPLSWHAREVCVPLSEGSAVGTFLVEPGMVGGRVPEGFGSIALYGAGPWSDRAMDLSDEVIEKELSAELDRLQPGATAALDFAQVLRVRGARPRFDVGHYRALARLERIESECRAEGRRMVLAGDYRMDPSWNGAAASGRRAAAALAGELLAEKGARRGP
jgi:oxygen-dependent protoporphyrinogen oxidase